MQTFPKESKPVTVSPALVLRPKLVLRVLTSVVIALGVINVLIAILRYRLTFDSYNYINILNTIFSLDREQNVPTYFSSAILLLAALLLLFIFSLKRPETGTARRYWGPLAVIFVLLSMEEYIGLHELSSDSLRDFTGLGTGRTSWLYYAWVLPAFVAAAAIGLYFLKFLFKLPIVTRRRFFWSGIMYVVATMGLELFGGHLMTTVGRASFPFALAATVEEMLEMFAISYFIFALLDYLKQNYRQELLISFR